jgi:hypothetical protein
VFVFCMGGAALGLTAVGCTLVCGESERGALFQGCMYLYRSAGGGTRCLLFQTFANAVYAWEDSLYALFPLTSFSLHLCASVCCQKEEFCKMQHVFVIARLLWGTMPVLSQQLREQAL